MQLTLTRKIFTSESTVGELAIDGVQECLRLEDPPRDVKIKGRTGIPAGTYSVVLGKSAKFKRIMPQVQNVDGFKGILIHRGISAHDTEGCIAVVTATLTQHQFDALVSFKFNTGRLAGTGLLTRVNGGQFDAVPAEFMKWVRSKGKVLAGLKNRRQGEIALWSKP